MTPGIIPGAWGLFPSQDPWENLALEQALFLQGPRKTWHLWFYINRPCIVIGRNQNPWREVRLSQAQARDLPVLRRFSGGGTVYHDLGNLNFSFLGPKESYSKPGILSYLVQGLMTLGLEVEMTPQGDLTFQGKKVSGQAFQILPDRVLHHGTLLFNADLASLRGVLGCEVPMESWTGVASRPMSVTNLTRPTGPLDASMLIQALTQGIPQMPQPGHQGEPEFQTQVQTLEAQLRSEAWTWEKTGTFMVSTPQGPLEIPRGRDPRTGEIFQNLIH